MDDTLRDLAALLWERDGIEAEIAELVAGSARRHDVGRFVASQVFDIDVTATPAGDDCDGRFRSGPLAGRTVSITVGAGVEAGMEVEPSSCDYHLVLNGPGRYSAAVGHHRCRISEVYLLRTRRLSDLLSAQLQTGTAARLRHADLAEGQLYPVEAPDPVLRLTRQQRELLSLFS